MLKVEKMSLNECIISPKSDKFHVFDDGMHQYEYKPTPTTVGGFCLLWWLFALPFLKKQRK